jgi:hypothetical protein
MDYDSKANLFRLRRALRPSLKFPDQLGYIENFDADAVITKPIILVSFSTLLAGPSRPIQPIPV